MTLFVAISCPEGIAVSCDSRGVVPSPKPNADTLIACENGCQLPVSDAMGKLYPVADRMVLGFHGTFSEGAHHVVRRIGEAGPYTEPAELIEWIASGLNKHDADRGLYPVVAGYDQTWRPWLLGTRRREAGADLDIILLNDATAPYGVATAGTFDRLAACLRAGPPLCTDWMHAQDAVDATRDLIWTEATLRRYLLQTPLVGGPIETVFIRHGGGLEWLSRQTLAARESGPAPLEILKPG